MTYRALDAYDLWLPLSMLVVITIMGCGNGQQKSADNTQ